MDHQYRKILNRLKRLKNSIELKRIAYDLSKNSNYLIIKLDLGIRSNDKKHDYFCMNPR